MIVEFADENLGYCLFHLDPEAIVILNYHLFVVTFFATICWTLKRQNSLPPFVIIPEHVPSILVNLKSFGKEIVAAYFPGPSITSLPSSSLPS
jgi:hypothetical protein